MVAGPAAGQTHCITDRACVKDAARGNTAASHLPGVGERGIIPSHLPAWGYQVGGIAVSAFLPYIQIVQIIISIALIAIILVQAKGQGGLGGIFGGEGAGVYRTRRGVEKTLFNVTIGLAVAFFVISIVSVLAA